ncbi:MAG: hypothetical protein ACK5QX_10680 [bacterium]
MFTRSEVRPETDFDFSGEMITKQSFAEECDINRILSQYQLTGVVNHLNHQAPQYGDVSQAPVDYQAALHQVQAAVTAFEGLPEAVRDRYQGDAMRFLDAFQRPEEEGFLRQAGLLAPPAGAGAPPASDVGGSSSAGLKPAGGQE